VTKLECFVPGSECDLAAERIHSQKDLPTSNNYGPHSNDASISHLNRLVTYVFFSFFVLRRLQYNQLINRTMH
jgi:hypothetical protein